MDKDTRNAIQRATQSARALLEREVGQQLEGDLRHPPRRNDRRRAGSAPRRGAATHAGEARRGREHHAALGRTRAEAVGDYLREAAFTTLNRFVALKMLEARELVQECVTRGRPVVAASGSSAASRPAWSSYPTRATASTSRASSTSSARRSGSSSTGAIRRA